MLSKSFSGVLLACGLLLTIASTPIAISYANTVPDNPANDWQVSLMQWIFVGLAVVGLVGFGFGAKQFAGQSR